MQIKIWEIDILTREAVLYSHVSSVAWIEYLMFFLWLKKYYTNPNQDMGPRLPIIFQITILSTKFMNSL